MRPLTETDDEVDCRNCGRGLICSKCDAEIISELCSDCDEKDEEIGKLNKVIGKIESLLESL